MGITADGVAGSKTLLYLGLDDTLYELLQLDSVYQMIDINNRYGVSIEKLDNEQQSKENLYKALIENK